MSDELPFALKKGTRVFARQLGKADVRGHITWVGPSRYGNGHRYGIKDDDGGTHWVNEDCVTPEVDPSAQSDGEIGKGSRVRITEGEHAGVEGDVYVAGPTGRFAIRDDDEETYWVERKHLESA